MKVAARDDAWRRVGADWPDALQPMQLEVFAVPGIEPTVVDLQNGLTVLCGVNAAGKTRLLSQVADALEGKVSGVSLRLPGPSRQVQFVDTFWLIQKTRLSFANDAALGERIDQAGLTPMRAEEVRLASYLLGRNYDSIQLAEMEATDEDQQLIDMAPSDPLVSRALGFLPEVVPYFVVERGGLQFSSPQLSQGELAGLTLLWALRQLDASSLVIIDEPETFLSPHSAQKALDVIAHFVGLKQCPALVSSHSYLGLAMAPPEHLLLMRPSGLVNVSLAVADRPSLWATLRLTAPKTIVFVVEDAAARQWLLFLLHRLSFTHLDVADVWVGGDRDAVRDAALFPSRSPSATMAVWGVLDGDERQVKRKGRQGNLLFLPGDQSPEEIIASALLKDEVDVPGLNIADVTEAYRIFEGGNPHDVVVQVATRLGWNLASFRHAVWDAWLHQTVEGQQFRLDLIEALKQVQPPAAMA
ncbi:MULTISPECIES: AAA family ATPase [unclassified Modestobacter]|uniref:AAA family ATPase n=1 Tax=unclassified Modestobacter TaxID=2643866 RepID=UPI0022AA8A7D|nr:MULTISPECIES: AAA family ATPase [unclassified Modestobacter]MCZ2826612.1 AAA family ATPase [Modestobacter sp. VKM Ac-2981]MCZ2854992.1 AAA family ATPase [Modestobacter sp. VKM Ac-2982]